MSIRSTNARQLRAILLSLTLQLTPLVAAQELLVEGSVQHPNGAPAMGFEVRLEPQPPSYSRRLQELRPTAEPSPQTVLGYTDKSGGFQLSAPEMGPWRLRVISPTGASVRTALAPLLESTQLPPVRFPSVTPSRVRVLGDDGQPLSKALVIVQGRYEDGRQVWAADRATARTNEDGWSEHTVVGAFAVMVAADGHVPVRTAIEAAVTTVELSRGIDVTVDVRDTHGRPVSGTIVRIGSSLLPVALTDEKGRATIVASTTEELPYQLESEDLGYAALALPPRALGSNSGNEIVKVTLEPPATVSGLVLDQKTGDPIGGALVWGSRRVEDATRTDSSGRYLLSTWTSSTGVEVSVTAPGYSRADTSQAMLEAQQIEMPSVSLWPVVKLSGEVLGSTGEALGGAKIRALEIKGEPGGVSLLGAGEKITPDDGRFFFDSIVRGSKYRIDIEHPTHVHTSVELTIPEDKALEPLVVTLDRGVTAWGRVIDANGDAIAGAEVELVKREHANPTHRSWRTQQASVPRATSDADGVFRLLAVAPGRHDLHAVASGFAPADVGGLEVPGDVDDLELGTLTLDPEATVRGVVTNERQQAVAEAKITTYPTSASGRSVSHRRVEHVTTNSAGEFVVRGLRTGERVNLTVEASGYSKRQLDAQPTSDQLSIVLQLGATASGRVLSHTGEPVAAARVTAAAVATDDRQPPRMDRGFSRTSADGRFELEGLAPGRWRLGVQSHDNRGGATQTIDLVAGQRLDAIEMTLIPGPLVTGTIVDDNGAPISGAAVTGSNDGTGEISALVGHARAVSDGRGAFRLSGLRLGSAQIRVEHLDYRSATRQIELSGDTEVTLTLSSGFRVTGRVIDGDGNPVGDAAVWPGAALEQHGYRTTTDAEGHFTLGGLESRLATITAAKEGFAPATEIVEAASGDASAARVTLRLGSGFTLSGTLSGLDENELSSVEVRAIGPGGMLQDRAGYDGTFTLQGLAPGTWHLSALLPNGRTRAKLVTIDSADTVVDLAFGDGFTVSGTIISSHPLPETLRIVISGHDLSAQRASSTTNATVGDDGSFVLTDVSAGNHRLIVSDAKGVVHNRQIDVSSDVRIEIELNAGSIPGIVLSSTGEALADATVTASSSVGAAAHFARTDGEGRFNLPAFEEKASVRVEADGHAARTVELDPAANEITVVLEPSATLRVRLATSDGTPVEYGMLWLANDLGSVVYSTQPRPSGILVFDQLPRGTHDVWIGWRGAPFARSRVEVPGDVALTLPPGGLVVFESSGFTESARPRALELTDANGQRYPAKHMLGALSGGSGNTIALYPSRWRLEITMSDGRKFVTEFDVFRDQITRVALREGP